MFFKPWNLTVCLTFCTPFILHIKSQLDSSKISYSLYHSFAQKFRLFLDCLQEMSKLLNLAFKAFHTSVLAYNFVSCVFIYFLLQSYLIFTLCKAPSLSQPLTFVQPHISALNAFLLALFKSHPLPNSWRPIANAPYFLKAFLSWAYDCMVISSFSGLL